LTIADQGIFRFRYGANGELRDGTGPGATEPSLAFAGLHRDVETLASYGEQRWYDERSGRWLSSDPVDRNLADPRGLHRWGYANGNPNRYTDPEGTSPALVTGAIGAGLGGLGGCVYRALSANGTCLKYGSIGLAAGGVAGLTLSVIAEIDGAMIELVDGQACVACVSGWLSSAARQ
jgi:RHS repeat-associated protein